jgi:hypothetical protein
MSSEAAPKARTSNAAQSLHEFPMKPFCIFSNRICIVALLTVGYQKFTFSWNDVSNRSASCVVKTGRMDLSWNGIGGLWLSSWKMGLNCARRDGNGAATEELRRSSVALICVEGIVAFATLAKSLSGDDGLRLELNRGVEIEPVRCRSFCPRSARSWRHFEASIGISYKVIVDAAEETIHT